MKAVLSGNEAIARAAWEAGVRVAVAYPGTPSTEIIENCRLHPEIRSQWSPNEKVALEVASGAAIGGARAICAMKHVGLNVAADPLFTMSYVGVNGGLVVVTADDPQMHSSQNEQDNRHYARAAKLPMVEPSDSAEAAAFLKSAFELSETYDTPVLLRVTTRICHSQGVVELGERREVPLRDYERDFEKYVMLPVNARKRHPIVEERIARLLKDTRRTRLNRIEKGTSTIGFITSGISYQYVKEAFPDAWVLKYGLTFPLNTGLARAFRKKVDRLYVVEEGDPYLEEQIKAAGVRVDGGKERTGPVGELSVDRVRDAFGKRPGKSLRTDVATPAHPPALCAGCSYSGVFTALREEKATVFGDIGCYTLAALPPISTMDICICMGASISTSIGFVKARAGEERKMACVIGDSTFLHSGIAGLIDAAHNRAAFVTLILDNSVTAMTGLQNNPTTGRDIYDAPVLRLDLAEMVRACGISRVDVVDPWDLAQLRSTLQKHWVYDEPSVIIARGECVAWSRRREVPYRVDGELCTGCGRCSQLGCPAIFFDKAGKKPSIDETLCVGCSLCAQVCGSDAVYRSDEEKAHKKMAVEVMKRRERKKVRAKKKTARRRRTGVKAAGKPDAGGKRGRR